MNIDYLIELIRSKIDAETLNQSEIAVAAGISRQRVNQVLRGKSKSRKTIRLMIRALNLEKEADAPSRY